ncbi:MAG: hypothetical protein EP347_11185 [Alphaproteobacteria bacterium]|nr:MAG: hypothetical protein EP347_11185 [Alphaproteobacteria bacterium]
MQFKITVGRGLSEDEAIAEATAAGLHPVTIEVPADKNDFHWHDFNSTAYLLEGSVVVTEQVSGKTYTVNAGDKFEAAARVIHREDHQGFKAVFAFDQDPATLKMPIDRSPAELAAE